MKLNTPLPLAIFTIAGTLATFAHDNGAAHSDNSPTALPPELVEAIRGTGALPAANSDALKAMADRYLSPRTNRPTDVSDASAPQWFAANTVKSAVKRSSPVAVLKRSKALATTATSSAFFLPDSGATAAFAAPAGNGTLMAAAFGAFKPRVRYYWDANTFYEESDNMPDNAQMPNLMVGITSWQQQVPLPAAYFASVTNPEGNAGSLGFGQPNYWRLPLTPTVASSPILIFTPGSTTNNFQRGAIALASNGIAIFNPANNTGRVSYEIGELDKYGGHCGLADDYHYHIIPTHLSSRFGGPLGDDKPVAWGLDGYPIYGYVEPDGSARQALDSHGGHDIGNGWGYHYHAMGTTTVDATHPYGTPQSPYTMTTFHGTVVNFGNQVDGQPEVGSLRASGTGGYTAQPVAGASITAFKNPVALSTDGSGHLVENVGGTPSQDSYLMRVIIGGISYDECWKINRNVNPRTLTITWRLSGATTTTTYTPGNATTIARLAAYGMADPSQVKIPDTSQVLDSTATFGEDSDYTLNPQSFTDNGNSTVTDNVTGLMWQQASTRELTWESAVADASTATTGNYTDWRLPTPSELFGLLNHNNGNPAAINTTYFPSASPAAAYWWTSDVFGTSTTNVWCANSGGGLGGKPKTEGATLQYHVRYVRGAKPTNGHNYRNNGDGTVTDLDTNLMWTQVPMAASNWDSALTACESLTSAGFSDWRLPNIKELQTITDYTLATASTGTATRPSLNRQAFSKTLTNCAVTLGNTTFTCSDTTGLLVGMPMVSTSVLQVQNCVTTINSATVTCPKTLGLVVGGAVTGAGIPANATISSIVVDTSFTMSANATASATINVIAPYVTSTAAIASITNPTTFVLTAAATGTGTNLTFSALPPPTAYWSSTAQKGDTAQAWLLETGINNSVPVANGPTRGSQGIISYESKTLASYPFFAVRSVPSGSITQGLATQTTANLFPAGQRVSAVGSITATDGSTWTVPAATSFATAPKASDLYNEYNAVTPANIAAAQTAINNLPTQVIDSDGEVVTGYIFADNYFELYVNGVLVGVDPVPYTSFNSCVVKFKAKRPITYAVRLVDWEENLGVGTELNGTPYHIGDGGFMASFSDGTVTNNQWKAQTFYIAPLDNPSQVVDLANGTHDSSAATTTHSLTTTAYALHYPLPADWFSKSFNAAGWPAATTYTEAQVGVNNITGYTNFPAQFSASGAQFIWSSNLLLDNEVVVRYTGPAPATSQITVEQPAGTALTDGSSTVDYASVNVNSTLTKTFTIKNNSSTSVLSITGTTIDGTGASLFTVMTAPAASIAASGSTSMIVQFAPTSGGAKTAALHIASSDSSVGAAFDINLTGTGATPAPTITNVTVSPNVPSNLDTPYVTATVTPGSGASISGVSLTYSTGAQATGPAFQEIFSNGSTTSGIAGAMNAWTTTNVRNAADVKQRSSTGNRTVPIVLTNCTTNASTAVTCASTTGLIPGMMISGTNIAANTTISQVNSSTAITLSTAATGSGMSLSLTAAGVTLTGCSLGTSPTINCASTTGLVVGMGIAGTGLTTNPPNPTVLAITNGTSFTVSSTVTAVPTTLTASGTGLDFSNGTAIYADTMAQTTSVISATAPTAGYVEFYVRNADFTNNNGWQFQISPDGGTASTGTWNTRLSENYASKTVALSNCVLVPGSTTVNCTSTTGLVAGMNLQGRQVALTCGTTNTSPTVTCTNTTGLVTGMFVSGTGIANGTRITAITPNTNFTISANASATGANVAVLANSQVWLTACGTTSGNNIVTCANTTGLVIGMYVTGTGIPNNTTVSAVTASNFTISANASSTNASVNVVAGYLNTNAVVANPITATSFTLNAAPVFSGTVSLDATTINHGFPATPYHYDLVAADMTNNMKMRFQFSGATSQGNPARPATCDIDDITVTLTTGAAPVQVQMFDDGLHGDGAAGDGVWGVQLPAFAAGTTVSYSIAATDNGSQTTTLASAGTYSTGSAPTITSSATLPNATPNVAYSTTLAATAGTPSYTWSLLSGNLPSGITLNGAGLISGTTSAQGTFMLTVKVTDSAGRVASKAFTLTVTTATAPNVLIILTDDQGWADVGYHTAAGQVPVQTPNMDRFGTDGIRLEKFYPTTICAVTRGCLLTGRNSLRTSVGNQKGLGLAEHLMPQTFKAAGYQTFMCGKWHIGGWDNNIYTTTMNGATIEVQHEGTEYHPLSRGWDFHKGQYGGAINYFTHTTSDPGRNNAVDWWQNGVQLLNDNTDLQGNGGYSTDLLADKAVELIQTRDPAKPMLLYLAFNAIHAGVSAPTSYLNKYATLGVTGNRRTICAAVDCMDVAMGRVLAALDTAGITNNTLIVFMSDNGGDTASGALNTPLRGTKSDSYDGGLHTPAGIRWPGKLAAGVTSNQYLWVGDIFPTVCAAVGVTPLNTKAFDGVNIWPQLQSITPASPDGAPRGVPLVTGDAGAPVALNVFTDPVSSTAKTFKLIYDKSTNPVTKLLYNMTDDPYETTDLWLTGAGTSYTTVVNTLTTAITGIVTESYPPFIGPTGITQAVAAGSGITLYAPFSSYKTLTSVQWRKNGANITNASPYYQVLNGVTPVNGVYMATLTLSNVTSTDAANYDVIVTNAAGNVTSPAGTLTVLTAPVLPAPPAFSSGTSCSLTWPAVSGATFYNCEIATVAGFSTTLATASPTSPTVTFSGLISGNTYYYRVRAGAGSVLGSYSNVVSSTQDALAPVLAITSPTPGGSYSTTHPTVTVQGTASDTLSGVSSVTVNGVAATTTDGFAHWSASVPLNLNANTVTASVVDNATNAGTSASVTVTRVTNTQNDGLPDSWKTAHGIDPNSSLLVNGPMGDIDRDGFSNLVEYALNLDPQRSDTGPLALALKANPPVTGPSYMEFSYPQRIGALDLAYTLEVSNDLASWSSAPGNFQPVSATPNGDGVTQTVTVRILPAVGATPANYVRVRVTLQ